MTTKKDIEKYVEKYKEMYKYAKGPIYRIFMFENADKELVYPTGKHSGFPNLGASCDFGFYYDLNDAIKTMNENITDLRETVYDAGFILCQFEGMGQVAGTNERMYFVWNQEKKGFFQAEEPKIFAHMAY